MKQAYRKTFFPAASTVYFLLLAAAQSCFALEEQVLDTELFVEKSCAANPVFSRILTDSLYLKYKEALEMPLDNYTLDFEFSYDYKPDTDNGGTGSKISLSRLFPATGTEGSINYQYTPGMADPSSSVSFEISQDIAENAFGKAYSLEGIGIDSQKKIAQYQIAEAYEEYLSVLIQEYYRWVSVSENLKTAENGYKEGLKLLENTEKRRASMIASSLDVSQMKLTVLDKKENLLKIRSEYDKTVRKIKDFMKDKSETVIKPGSRSINLKLDDDFDTAFEKIKTGARTFFILDELEKSGLNSIEIKKRALMPSAELFSAYRYGGAGYLPEADPVRSLSFGVRISTGFPDKKQKAALETASIDYSKTLLSREISTDSLRLALYELYQQIKDTDVLSELYNEKLSAAEMILKDEEQNFKIGKSTLKDYTDAINRLDSIRYGIQSLKAQKNIYNIEWMRLSDTLAEGKLPDLIN